MVFLIELLMSLFYQPNSVIETLKPQLTRIFNILICTTIVFPYCPLFGTSIFPYISQYGRDYFCSCHLGLSCITMGIQNNSSHNSSVPKEHPLSEQGAFLVPVPIDKPTFQGFHLFHVHLSFGGEELETLRSGNKETLASGLCNNPPQQNRAVFLCLL